MRLRIYFCKPLRLRLFCKLKRLNVCIYFSKLVRLRLCIYFSKMMGLSKLLKLGVRTHVYFF